MNHVITFYTHTRPSVEDIRDALKKPVPNAAEVSAVVARLWHLGMAEDAWRRRQPWFDAVMLAHLRGGHGKRAESMSDYFGDLMVYHRQAAEGVQR